MALITAAMRQDRLGRPGMVGLAVDVVRSTVAWSATYMAANMLPAMYGSAGAAGASVVAAAALIVAAPGFLTRCGVRNEDTVAAVRAAAWTALTVTTAWLLSASIVAGTTAGIYLIWGSAVVFAVFTVLYRVGRWADFRTDTVLPVSRRLSRKKANDQ